MASEMLVFMLCLGVALAGLVDRGQDAADALKLPLLTGYIRVEMHLMKLDTQGKSHTGLPCDVFDRCDPKILAFIDTEKPNHDFGPDSVPYDAYVNVFEGNNAPDVVDIDKTISRDICGKSIRKIAMRVRAIDKDGINDDKIDNYKCHIDGLRSPPAESESQAEWSVEIPCNGEDRPTSKVYLRYRWYFIPENVCRPSSNGRGFLSGLLSRK